MSPDPSARLLIHAVGLLMVAGPLAAQRAPWPTAGWATSTPSDQGMDAAPLDELDRRIRADDYGLVDRLVVTRNGWLVYDRTYERDYREISRGRRSPIGCGIDACTDAAEVHQFNYLHPDHHPFYMGRRVHSLQSVTKSVSSALIGIAIGRGEIAGVDAPLLSFFEDYDLSGTDPRLRAATLDDLLTMRSGIEWHETDRPFNDTNTTLQLEAADDWVQFTLSQPMDAEPGTKWVYNSGGSHLMSGIIRAATGSTIDVYAERHLFGPLGITDYHWKKTPKGLPDTEGGLYLEAPQLARIGYLYLNDGVWDGQRILPQGWVAASTGTRVSQVNAAGFGYGYQWWRIDRGQTAIWAGQGFGDQYLIVIPEYDIVAVVNCWNLFGRARANIRNGLVDALLAAVR